MRIPFSSRTIPTDAADRLAFLLPALSREQVRDWTAQVYGYQNWFQLVFNVGAEVPAAVAALEPDPSHSLATCQADQLHWGATPARAYQVEKLSELMGLTDEAAENLYNSWCPMMSGAFTVRNLADLGEGTPAFRLLQRDLFHPNESCALYYDFESGAAYNGFPGTATEQAAAVAAFIEKLPAEVQEGEGAELAMRLREGFATATEVRPVGGPNTFAQIRRVSYFVIDETSGVDIVAAAPVTFSLFASCDGTHSVKVTLEKFVSIKHDEDLDYSMAGTIAANLWHAVGSYLWCVLGNTDFEALVHVEHRVRDPKEQECANLISELLASYCGWPNAEDRPEDYGIQFMVSKRARSDSVPTMGA